MQRKRLIIMIAFAGSGLSVGVMARYLVGEEFAADAAEKPVVAPVLTPSPGTIREQDTTRVSAFRPSLEELLEAGGFEASLLTVAYLQGASMDEIVPLLTKHMGASRFRNDLATLVIRRGIEVDPMALLAAIREYSPKSRADHWLGTALEAWASLDSEAALAASREESKYVRQRLIVFLTKSDPEQALMAAQREFPGDEQLRRRIDETVFQDRIESDLEGALGQAMAMPNRHTRKEMLLKVMQAWAQSDAVAAFRWWETQAALPERTDLLGRLISSLNESDPALARQALDELPLSPERGRLEGRMLAEWAAADQTAALEWVRSRPEGPFRDYLFSSMLEKSSFEPTELLRLVEEMDIDVGAASELVTLRVRSQKNLESSTGSGTDSLRRAVTNALRRLAGESPHEALDSAARVFGHGSDDFAGSARTIVVEWANRTPAEAARWALEIPESSLADRLQHFVFDTWARNEPEQAAQLLLDSNRIDDTGVGGLIRSVMNRWGNSDPGSLLDWASRAAEQVGDQTLHQAIHSVARSAPELAAQKVTSLESIPHQQSATDAVARGWSRRDPASAAAWLMEQPDECIGGPTVASISTEWVLDDPTAASEWISGLESSTIRDHAVAGMVDALISNKNPHRDFEAATQWTSTVENPGLQTRLDEEIARAIEREEAALQSIPR